MSLTNPLLTTLLTTHRVANEWMIWDQSSPGKLPRTAGNSILRFPTSNIQTTSESDHEPATLR